MTARGSVFIESTDDQRLLQTQYVQDYLHEYAAEGELLLGEVNTLNVGRLTQEAPDVAWLAYADPDTEAAGIMYVHLPGRGVFLWEHLNNEPVLSLDAVLEYGIDAVLGGPELQALVEVRRLIKESEREES